MQNIWTLKLDIKKPYGNLIPTFTTGDTNKLIVKIYDNSIAVDLDEENITSGILNMKKADGTIISLMNTVIPYNDRVEITFGNETDSLGEVTCKLMLYDDNMVERISTSEFKIVFDEDWVATYPENPSVDLATQMIQAFTSLEQRIDDIEAGAGNAHSHDNYDTLSKIRYTGDAEEIDLADIEDKADVEHNHDDLYQPIGGYAPANHNHDDKYADIEHDHNGVYQPIGDYAPTNHDHDTEYAPIEHEHDIEDVTGLDTALSGKADVEHNHDEVYSPVEHNHDGTYAPANHNHNDVYAPIEHDHAISDVDGLQTALNGKSNTNHTHTGTYAPVVHNHDEVYSPVDHNHDSDYADKTSTESHISNESNPHKVTKSQVGLGNVDNTSDLNKPISTATQAALDLKSNINHNHDSDYADINHNHDGVYEPVFTKNTAFNKNFGTGSGQVAEGNHTHSIYPAKDVAETINSPWVFDKGVHNLAHYFGNNNQGDSVKYVRLARVKMTGGAEIYNRAVIKGNCMVTGSVFKMGYFIAYLYKIHSGGDLNIATSLTMINDTGVATFNFAEEDIWYQDWSTNDPNISYVDIIMKIPTWGKNYFQVDYGVLEPVGGYTLMTVNPDNVVNHATLLTTIPTAGTTISYEGLTLTAKTAVAGTVKTLTMA